MYLSRSLLARARLYGGPCLRSAEFWPREMDNIEDLPYVNTSPSFPRTMELTFLRFLNVYALMKVVAHELVSVGIGPRLETGDLIRPVVYFPA